MATTLRLTAILAATAALHAQAALAQAPTDSNPPPGHFLPPGPLQPPAQVPPAQVPPAQVPPAQVPPAQVPPAQVPQTPVPQTPVPQTPVPQTDTRPASPGTTNPATAGPSAEPAPPGQADDRRFTFHRDGDGFLRVDMQTGAVASCTKSGADWACAPGRDERAALDGEISRLKRDNAVLKNALLEHGIALPAGMAPPPPGNGGDTAIPRPPQTVPPAGGMQETAGGDVDRVVGAIQRGWRRLVDTVTNLERELQQDQ